jgi:hypothetical protein
VQSKRQRARQPFEFDRVIAMRAVLVVIVVLFLYMILEVSMIAFGGSAAREAKRIERAIDAGANAPVPAGAAPSKPAAAASP